MNKLWIHPEDLPLEDNSELKSDDLTEDDLPF